MECYVYDEPATKEALKEYDEMSLAHATAYLQGDYSVLPPYPMVGIVCYTLVDILEWEY